MKRRSFFSAITAAFAAAALPFKRLLAAPAAPVSLPTGDVTYDVKPQSYFAARMEYEFDQLQIKATTKQ